MSNRDKYTKAERDAWQSNRIADEVARGLYGNKTWNGKAWVQPNGEPLPRAPKAPNPFGKEGTLAKSINEQLAGFEAYRQKQVNQAVANAAPKHARLIADGEDSTCLERLTWKDGIATATFFRGGQITYDYPMSRDEFVDWVSFGSLGKYGNENVFD
jgi:hypothetical protein